MIILASTSWLRKEILKKSEIAFTIQKPTFHEQDVHQKLANKPLPKQAVTIAIAKARAVEAKASDIIIAADTMAVLRGQKDPFHKPKHEAEALQLALAQSGKSIDVITGYCLKKGQLEHSGFTKTHITYVDFDEKTISRLLAMDTDPTIRNAGLGFFIDAPGFTLVKSFEGSFTGAMGLPMEHIRPLIQELQSNTEKL